MSLKPAEISKNQQHANAKKKTTNQNGINKDPRANKKIERMNKNLF